MLDIPVASALLPTAVPLLPTKTFCPVLSSSTHMPETALEPTATPPSLAMAPAPVAVELKPLAYAPVPTAVDCQAVAMAKPPIAVAKGASANAELPRATEK